MNYLPEAGVTNTYVLGWV